MVDHLDFDLATVILAHPQLSAYIFSIMSLLTVVPSLQLVTDNTVKYSLAKVASYKPMISKSRSYCNLGPSIVLLDTVEHCYSGFSPYSADTSIYIARCKVH